MSLGCEESRVFAESPLKHADMQANSPHQGRIRLAEDFFFKCKSLKQKHDLILVTDLKFFYVNI